MSANTTIENVQRVYNGKQGCMCGCNGNYTNNKATIKKTYDLVMNDPKRETLDIGDAIAVSSDTPNGRTHVVYFNK